VAGEEANTKVMVGATIVINNDKTIIANIRANLLK
jgi:hypothetical protein